MDLKEIYLRYINQVLAIVPRNWQALADTSIAIEKSMKMASGLLDLPDNEENDCKQLRKIATACNLGADYCAQIDQDKSRFSSPTDVLASVTAALEIGLVLECFARNAKILTEANKVQNSVEAPHIRYICHDEIGTMCDGLKVKRKDFRFDLAAVAEVIARKNEGYDAVVREEIEGLINMHFNIQFDFGD